MFDSVYFSKYILNIILKLFFIHYGIICLVLLSNVCKEEFWV